MKTITSLLILIIGIFLFSCVQDSKTSESQFDEELKSLAAAASLNDRFNDVPNKGSYKYYILPDENDLRKIPQDPKNPLTKDKVALGKMFFYETALAVDALHPSGVGTYSCSSCHLSTAGFRPGRAQGIADGGMGIGVNGETRIRNKDYAPEQLDAQAARPLALINTAYVTNTFWNGQFGSSGVNIGTEEYWDNNELTELNHLGYHGIETQNIEGMNLHRLSLDRKLVEDLGYKELYDKAFPEVQFSDRYTKFTASFAFSAYIRTILSNQAPFQRFLKGEESALDIDEKKGGILFFGKARCGNCHYRPNLGSLEFHALGVNDMEAIPSFNTPEPRRNPGRGAFTEKKEDMFAFKVPGIYNMVDAPYYFHGASKRTLDELVDYKIAAQSENSNIDQSLLSEKFLPLILSEEEREQLLHFIKNGLRDPDLKRYEPEYVLSGNCIPNNDPQSRLDYGCN